MRQSDVMLSAEAVKNFFEEKCDANIDLRITRRNDYINWPGFFLCLENNEGRITMWVYRWTEIIGNMTRFSKQTDSIFLFKSPIQPYQPTLNYVRENFYHEPIGYIDD